MCDSSNLHTEQVCSCANHNLPTYEEAVRAAVPYVEPTGIHTIFTTPKTETNHDRQHLAQPSIDSPRSRNTHYTHRPSASYHVYNSYRTPSYNRTRYATAGNTSSNNANDSGTRGYNANDRSITVNQKSDTPCQSSVAIAAFFVVVLFIIIAVMMKGYTYLRREFG